MNEPKKLEARLGELLRYDRLTGAFTWLVSRSRVKAGTLAGQLSEKGYVVIVIDGKRHKAHRLAWLIEYGAMPDGFVDHINGKRDDNRICNLRIASPRENAQNRTRPSRHSSSGFLGVQKNGPRKWKAVIQVDGRRVFLGNFDDPCSAHMAYVAAKTDFHDFYRP